MRGQRERFEGGERIAGFDSSHLLTVAEAASRSPGAFPLRGSIHQRRRVWCTASGMGSGSLAGVAAQRNRSGVASCLARGEAGISGRGAMRCASGLCPVVRSSLQQWSSVHRSADFRADLRGRPTVRAACSRRRHTAHARSNTQGGHLNTA